MNVLRARRAGFSMVEVLIASALLGLSLIVMFGFHSQAVRSNMNAHRQTDCAYLAQTQMERLLAADWSGTTPPTDLTDAGGVDPATVDMWVSLESPSLPNPVNAANSLDTLLGPTMYTITWDVEDMDADATWVRLRVRCAYPDSQFNTWHATTISSYRYRDS